MKQPESEPPRTVLIGNFLSRHLSTRTVGEDLKDHLEAAGWPVAATSHRLPRLARLWGMQHTIWTQGPFAVAQVDVYSGAAFLWAEAASHSLRLRQTPTVLTLHGGRLPEFARRWPRRVRRLLTKAAAVTTPSRYLLREMAPYRSDLRLLPNPLDLAAYSFTCRRHPSANMVWLRAFHRIYNPRMAPHVLAELASSHPEARLTMVGPDKGDGTLEQTRREAEALGVADRLVIRGPIPKNQVPELLASADIFLNTTDVDNAPVSVMEAMACGLCVVSTDAGGLPDLLDNGRDALLVKRDDAPAMASAIAKILEDSALAARLSDNARRKAETSDGSRVFPQWEALLEETSREL